MSRADRRKICRGCHYFYPTQADVLDVADEGFCRRFPLTFRHTDSQARWPIVEGRDWCGEYKLDQS